MTRININLNPKRTRTQNQKVLEYLQSGRSLTQRDATLIFGISRLASRISDLRHKYGHPEIQSKTIAVMNSEGSKTYVSMYFIEPQLDLNV